jgi:5'-3' exoribonuclease 1
MQRFPEFIAKIEANPQGDGWEDTAFYSDPDVAKQKMKEIGTWLKSVETKSFERVPLEAEQMDGDTVMMIEQAADRNNAAGTAMQGKEIGNIPRTALLKPADAEQRTGQQFFKIGDRVVYVLDSGRVPIAMRGTVVGKTRTARQTLLDVVFDSQFMSGTTLNDRCSRYRGSTVPSNAVLNLTDRQVVATSQAAKARAPQPSYAPLRATGGNMATTYGAPGGPQLRQADAPPPLRGSFRGAVSGMQQNGRGGYVPRGNRGGFGSSQPNGMPYRPRGGTNGASSSFTPRGNGRGGAPNRQGFTVVDNSDPAAGVVNNNSNFRPQNYSNVPPPASLDSRGRGRGTYRGNSRGRGRGQVTAN